MHAIQQIFSEVLSEKKRRTMREYAREEIVICEGPEKGQKYNPDTSVVHKYLFDEIEDKNRTESSLMAGVQIGKTTFIVIVTLYAIDECKENVIIGIPTKDMAEGLWFQKIRPMFIASGRKHLLPTRGPGSQGSFTNLVQFNNGATLRFMPSGGSDSQRSGFTAKWILCTEVDKMAHKKTTSKETHPVFQIHARSTAYAAQGRKIFNECTPSTTLGFINQSVNNQGTGSQLTFPCPKCNEHQTFDPEQLVIQGDSPVEVIKNAAYKCIKCKYHMNDLDKQRAILKAGIMHKPEHEKCLTFGLNVPSFFSSFMPLQEIVKMAWEERENPSQDLTIRLNQFIYAKPYDPDSDVDFDGKAELQLLKKRAASSKYVTGDVVKNAKYLIMACDIGSRYIHYVLMSYDAQGQCLPVKAVRHELAGHGEHDLAQGLLDIREILKCPVIIDKKGTEMKVKLCFIDAHYRTQQVLDFAMEQTQKYKGHTPVYPCYGMSSNDNARHTRSSSVSRNVGERVIVRQLTEPTARHKGIQKVFIDTVYFKDIIMAGLTSYEENEPYYINFGHGTSEHLLRSLCSETRMVTASGRAKYIKSAGNNQNHYFDCVVYAHAAFNLIVDVNKK